MRFKSVFLLLTSSGFLASSTLVGEGEKAPSHQDSIYQNSSCQACHSGGPFSRHKLKALGFSVDKIKEVSKKHKVTE
ncbi:hypothetical protein Bealeia1_00689 [Candidatus Bealeia paramacronuclearis]|uniref:Cytochrome c domain-containing protein n=1 Tax=Candidatus Bealeia paramacronuclearis TaxID=1921001 RepID=A0ABZ2C4Z9_9PROT|nr:hypothetical protein [Candidatus Bealeia paramacronuclearis]